MSNDNDNDNDNDNANANTNTNTNTNTTESSSPHSQRRRAAPSSPLDLPTPNDHLVASLPLLDPGTFPTKQWAGLLPLSQTEDDKYIFYWLIEPDFSDTADEGLSEDDPAQVPLVIWLNGGPGCSSLEGLMIENGPFQLVKDGDGWKLRQNPYSWHKIPAWVLYIDQPVGTGFSFTKKRNYSGNDEAVNKDFYAFLQTFLSMYREYFVKTESGSNGLVLNREFYFSGESHAGHYIPSMMDYILQMNDIVATQTPPRIRIPLSGAALGNPWTDPFHQYAAADIAFGFGFIDAAQKKHLDDLEMVCRQNINEWMKSPSTKQPKHCLELVDTVVKASNGAKSYNVNYWSVEYPPGKSTAENYFRGKLSGSSGINAALNLEGFESYFGKFSECSNAPYNALFHQDCLGVVDELVRVLDHPNRPHILFYFGMADFVCNHVSGEKMLDALPWDRAPSWTLAERFVWKLNDGNGDEDPSPSGYVKEFENLSLLKVPHAGHMVPMEKPVVSLEMMRVLVGRRCFKSSSFAQSMEKRYPRQPYLPERCVDCPDCTNVFSDPHVCSPRPAVPPTSPTSTSSSGTPGDSDSEGQQQIQTDLQSLSKESIIGASASFLFLMTLYAFLTFDPRKAGAAKLSTTAPEEAIEYGGENSHVHSIELT